MYVFLTRILGLPADFKEGVLFSTYATLVSTVHRGTLSMYFHKDVYKLSMYSMQEIQLMRLVRVPEKYI